MNPDDSRQVSEWIHEYAAHRVPAHLDTVLRETGTRRQRPAWSIPERWIPMDITSRARTFAPPRLGRVLLVALLILVLVAFAVVAVGSRPHRVPAPFGPALNGELLASIEGDLFRADPTTGVRTPIVAGASYDFSPIFSHDGTRVAFLRGAVPPPADGSAVPVRLATADSDGSNVTELTGDVDGLDGFDWSPDGSRIAYISRRADDYGLLNIVDVATRATRTIDPGVSVQAGLMAWRPPLGDQIVFLGDDGVHAVRPDGTHSHRLDGGTANCSCSPGSLSPDGKTLTLTRWTDAGARIWLLNLDDHTERLLPILEGTVARGGAFSADGRELAYPRLTALTPNQFAYQVVVAMLDGRDTGLPLGPTITLPSGTDEAFATLAFTPDGSALLAAYPDNPTSDNLAIWWLPVDGTQGRQLAHGQMALFDMQRLAR